ncbi:hypothetical protein [Sediminicola luteus]|uniref:Uncharacterized protein n=1 Tax=Sediminicola luteus TaxID=319238 RepID=A0A2A4G8Y9_9FLAO|nr:hypothetical protein [Sediminicola luteus]PCE64903.1 hypothetical protein B7P33_06995 [Sediminicola luteus]
MRWWSYIRFWISAHNHHGVHSPFVYRLITEGLYPKLDFKGSASDLLFLKTIRYFHPAIQNTQALPERLKQETQKLSNDKTEHSTWQLWYWRQPQSHLPSWEAHSKKDTILYVHAPYASKTTEQVWKDLKLQQQVRITVDFYYGVLVFFRDDQEKQHFRIRPRNKSPKDFALFPVPTDS